MSQASLHAGGTLKPNPPAGDPYEHQDQVPLAFDGNSSTSWSTQWYPTPVFGGLRDAVGIYGDAGQPVVLKRIEVDTALPGWTAAIETSDDGQNWSAPGPTGLVARYLWPATGRSRAMLCGRPVRRRRPTRILE